MFVVVCIHFWSLLRLVARLSGQAGDLKRDCWISLQPVRGLYVGDLDFNLVLQYLTWHMTEGAAATVDHRTVRQSLRTAD